MSTHGLIVNESGNYFGANSWSWRSFASYGIMQNRYNSGSGEYHGIMRFDVAAIRALNASNKAISIKFHMTRGSAGDTGDTKTGLGIGVGYGVYGSVTPSISRDPYNGQSLSVTNASLSPGVGTATTYTISNRDQAAAWIDYLCAGSNKCFIFSRRLIDDTFGSYARIDACTLEIAWESRATAPTAPTSVIAAPNPFEGSLILQWGGAQNGANNNIARYNVAYQTSSNGSSWGSETVVSQTGIFELNTSSWARGTYFRYRVQSIGSVSGLNSGYSGYSAVVRKNVAPNAPTNPKYNGAARTSSYYTESPLVFSWSAPSVPSGGSSIARYEVQLGVWNGSGYVFGSPISVGTALSYSWAISGYSRGQRLWINVRTVDKLGAVSGWAGLNSSAIYYNQLASAPTISYPTAGSTVYGTRPRICFTLGTDADGQTQTPVATVGGATAASSAYSRYGALASGSKLVLRPAAAQSGSVSVTARGNDGLVNGTQATRTFTVKPMTWEDTALTDSYELTPGVTRIKASHFTDLRTKIANVRAAYGLSAVSWLPLQNPVSAAVMLQMQAAIDDIRSAINGYDTVGTGNLIPAFGWSTIAPGVTIMAAHINELRDALTTL